MKRGVRALLAIVGVSALAAVAIASCSHKDSQPATAEKSEKGDRSDKGGAAGRGASGAPVPVAVATVELRDVPIFLEGLGSVTAANTVTVRSQVDGRLDRIAFTEGQAVRKGDLLAQIDPRPFEIQVRQAEAALGRDQAMLENARLTLERYQSLSPQKLVAQQQIDDQRAAVAQLEAALKTDHAQIDNAKLQLGYTHITSPIDGVSGIRLVDAGNIIRSNDPTGIVIITELDPIAVVFTLPEDELPRISEEMSKRTLEVEAFSRDGTSSLGKGKVKLVDNQINSATGTIKLKAMFPNAERHLWPNQFVKARLLLTVKQDAIVVPAAVVQRGPKGPFAYVLAPDQTAAIRPIELEMITGEIAVMKSGLRPGEQVVTEGQYRLTPGARVSIRTPEGPKTRTSTRTDASTAAREVHTGGPLERGRP